jgi:hypothetical protein
MQVTSPEQRNLTPLNLPYWKKEPTVELQDKQLEQVLDLATKTALSNSAKHVATVATGNPVIGKAAGLVTGAAYSCVPAPVKGGAAIGGLVAVHGASHIASIGTAGSLAAGASFLALAPWLIVGGAAVGGLLWLFRDN